MHSNNANSTAQPLQHTRRKDYVSRHNQATRNTHADGAVVARLVAVHVGLEGTLLGHVQVVGLLGGQGGQLDAELVEVQTSNLLIELRNEMNVGENEL